MTRSLWTRMALATVGLLCLLVISAHGWRRGLVQPKGFVLASNQFGLNLFDKLGEENERLSQKNNLFYSPYSVATAVAMLHQGSGGNTAKQLETALGYELAKLSGDKSLVAMQVQNSTSEIFLPEDSNSTSYTLRSGNALLTDQTFPVLETFKKNLQENFQAELFSVDFANNAQAVMEQINGWCANKTDGKIDKLLAGPPSASTKLALLNAVYFKGTWKLKFDPNRTEPGTFHGANGQNFENVSFMQTKDYFNVGYLTEIDADLFELEYEGEDLSLYAFLPKDANSDLKLIRKALNPWYVESAISRIYSQEVELKLPKFNFKTNYDLVPSLHSLGISDIFGSQSDLSALSSDSNLAVDQVKHMASIEVHEDGSVAAAATYIGIVRLSLPLSTPSYVFDHPFLFLIRHNKNGQILFIGEVNRF